MQIDFRVTIPESGREFRIEWILSDLSDDDIRYLIERSGKPLSSPLGASMKADSPISGIEAACMLLAKFGGSNPDEILARIRQDVYQRTAAMTMLKMAEKDKRQ